MEFFVFFWVIFQLNFFVEFFALWGLNSKAVESLYSVYVSRGILKMSWIFIIFWLVGCINCAASPACMDIHIFLWCFVCRDDQILLNRILFYVGYMILPGAAHMPLWRTDGVLLTILLHMGPVEFLYYWLHRALHHHYLYSRYHSHHHSSIVTEPITCMNWSFTLWSVTN